MNYKSLKFQTLKGIKNFYSIHFFYFQNFRSKMRANKIIKILSLVSILLFVSQTVSCDNTTVLLTLHGRGESKDGGSAKSFVTRLQTYLKTKSLDKRYKILNVGLSDDNEEDYYWSSFTSMSFQTQALCQYLNKPEVWQQLSQSSRIVLVGFSQGGLLLRGLLSTDCLDPLLPRIDKLITFGAPHSGVFGKPDCSQFDTKYEVLIKACELLQKFDDLTHLGPALYDIFMYTDLAEIAFSAASYWNSPNNPSQRKTWLAEVDYENNNNRDKYLSRKLNRGLVMISFGLEATVLPPISTKFGYWDSKASNLIAFNETEIYLNDWIGLRELDSQNLVQFYTIENEPHCSVPNVFIDNQFLGFVN